MRSILYVLLPLSIVVGLFLISQGVIQNLHVGGGPAASQVAIKQLGTNGGGFFNVNSAHPWENPTWVSNFVEMLSILLIPAALTATYGRMVGNRRQGWAVYSAMTAMLLVGIVVVAIAESNASPAMQAAGIHGANLEGKELRTGIPSTALWAVVTTAASNGSVNGAMESLTGIGGVIPMANMQTGEVIFGGVGSGLFSILMFAILGVFLCGLMVGRTPEFLGKKIEAREIKLTVFGTIGVPLLVLLGTALAMSKWGKASMYDSGPQGFSEALYAYTSQGNNNGSAFAGYTGFVQPPDSPGVRHQLRRPRGRPGDARRPVPPAPGRVGHRGCARAQEGDARRRRHVPDRLADLRGRAGRRDPARRPVDLRPRPAPRPVVQGMTDQLF